jgi:glutamate carboxypeptidase
VAMQPELPVFAPESVAGVRASRSLVRAFRLGTVPALAAAVSYFVQPGRRRRSNESESPRYYTAVSTVAAECERRRDEILGLVRDLAAIESPSGDVAALDRCAARLVASLERAGAAVTRPRYSASTAAHVQADWPGNGSRVLVLGHFDTVYPLGQLQRQPVEVRDGRLFGPGVYDMKAGLAIAVCAIEAVMSTVSIDRRPAITMFATADEEVGSETSRALIENLAKQSSAVLVLEPALASGAVKTARKGVGDFEIAVHGVPAHAGVDPSAGASAIHELATLVGALRALSDPSRGLTVNIGTIEGGTRPNVVAERARARVDVRIAHAEDAEHIRQAIAGLRAEDPRARVVVTGGINRPPMERTAGVARLFELARTVARDQGWTLEEGSTGGGSDGNFTAALGVPTLDGLGAVGDGAHAQHEHIVINELTPRAALVAGLIERLGDNGWRS